MYVCMYALMLMYTSYLYFSWLQYSMTKKEEEEYVSV